MIFGITGDGDPGCPLGFPSEIRSTRSGTNEQTGISAGADITK